MAAEAKLLEQRADFFFVIGREGGKSGREGEEKAKG